MLVCEDELVKLAIDEAGDVVKRWNLRYFMLLVGSQPTLVYYRKVSDRRMLLPVDKGHLTGSYNKVVVCL